MTKFLLPVLALAATLSLPPSAQAEDVSRDHLKSQVDQYLDVMFSAENVGIVHKRDGVIHKLAQPINVRVDWPECEPFASEAFQVFRQHTGIDINYEKDLTPEKVGGNTYHLSIIILGVHDVSDLKRDKNLYSALSNYAFASEKELIDEVESSFKNDRIKAKYYYNDNGEMDFSVSIINNSYLKKSNCYESIINDIIVPQIDNFSSVYYNDKFIEYNNLFISALYDKSIMMGEPEDSARSKIAKLMLNKLEGK